MRQSRIAAMLLTVCLALLPPVAFAKDTPGEEPVVLIVPFGKGGAVDVAAHILVDYWKKAYKQETQVECRPGGAGGPAMVEFFNLAPNTPAMAFVSTTGFASGAQVKPSGYDLSDLQPLGQVTVMWMCLAVNASSPVRDINELFRQARLRKGRITYGSHSPLSPQRLFMNRLMRGTIPGVELPHVALPSGAAVTQALLSGRVHAGFAVPSNMKQALNDGAVRMLAVTSPARLPEYPNVPTFAELYGPEYAEGASHGLVTQKSLSPEWKQRLTERLEAALKDPEVLTRFENAGIPVDFLPTEAFRKVLEEDWSRVSALIQEGLL